MAKNWYQFVHNQGSDSADILIYDVIGGDWFGDGTSAKGFVSEMNALQAKDVKTINIRINSPGGSVWDGMAILSAIERYNGDVYTHIDGIAYSMAAIIAIKGKKSFIAKQGRKMLHNAITRATGNAKEMREVADNLDGYDDILATTIMEKTGLSLEEVKEKYLNYKDQYFNASQAVELGLIDEISDFSAQNVEAFKDYKEIVAQYKEAVITTPINIQNQNNMKYKNIQALYALIEAGTQPNQEQIEAAVADLAAANTGFTIANKETITNAQNAATSLAQANQTISDINNLFENKDQEGFNLLASVKEAIAASKRTPRSTRSFGEDNHDDDNNPADNIVIEDSFYNKAIKDLNL